MPDSPSPFILGDYHRFSINELHNGLTNQVERR